MSDEKASINSISQETHENVLRLHQKLRGLLVEIEAKMEVSDMEPDSPGKQARKQQMESLHSEVSKALASIKTLVQVLSTNQASALFNLSNEDLSSFRDLIKESVEKITKMKEEF